MKKNMIVGMAMAMGILSVGAFSASAASSCCTAGSCADKHVVQQFKQETSALSSALKAKDAELRELYSYDRTDARKADEIEAEIKELKSKITLAGEKYGIQSCCLS